MGARAARRGAAGPGARRRTLAPMLAAMMLRWWGGVCEGTAVVGAEAEHQLLVSEKLPKWLCLRCADKLCANVVH